MMKRVILIAMAALSGCGSMQQPAVPDASFITVDKPVFACHAPQVDRPAFPFDSLPVGSDIYTQAATLLADRDLRRAYELKLEAVQSKLH